MRKTKYIYIYIYVYEDLHICGGVGALIISIFVLVNATHLVARQDASTGTEACQWALTGKRTLWVNSSVEQPTRAR